MPEVQVAIADARYALALRQMLESAGTRAVHCVDRPDVGAEGVIVVDSEALNHLPVPLLNPERVVLITRNDPEHLAEAWNAGIRSVVFNEDPLSTAVLAVMAAALRVPKPDPGWSGSRTRHGHSPRTLQAAPRKAVAKAASEPAQTTPEGGEAFSSNERRG